MGIANHVESTAEPVWPTRSKSQQSHYTLIQAPIFIFSVCIAFVAGTFYTPSSKPLSEPEGEVTTEAVDGTSAVVWKLMIELTMKVCTHVVTNCLSLFERATSFAGQCRQQLLDDAAFSAGLFSLLFFADDYYRNLGKGFQRARRPRSYSSDRFLPRESHVSILWVWVGHHPLVHCVRYQNVLPVVYQPNVWGRLGLQRWIQRDQTKLRAFSRRVLFTQAKSTLVRSAINLRQHISNVLVFSGTSNWKCEHYHIRSENGGLSSRVSPTPVLLWDSTGGHTRGRTSQQVPQEGSLPGQARRKYQVFLSCLFFSCFRLVFREK